jgi:hypothetical protein
MLLLPLECDQLVVCAVQDMYPMLVLAAGCMELLGGVLFTLNLTFGAFLLVRELETALNW